MSKGKSTLRRDWSAARAKLEREGKCRVCGTTRDLQCSHTIGRKYQDVPVVGPRGGKVWLVKEDAVVPLCGPTPQGCHGKYDRRELDLLPYLSVEEQVYAVECAGGIVRAFRRLTGGAQTLDEFGERIVSEIMDRLTGGAP